MKKSSGENRKEAVATELAPAHLWRKQNTDSYLENYILFAKPRQINTVG